MKTFIAAITFSFVAAGSAVALDTNQLGVPASTGSAEVYEMSTTSGFTGQTGDFNNMLDVNDRGIPASANASYVADADQVVGFGGINSADIENRLDNNDLGLPASLR